MCDILQVIHTILFHQVYPEAPIETLVLGKYSSFKKLYNSSYDGLRVSAIRIFASFSKYSFSSTVNVVESLNIFKKGEFSTPRSRRFLSCSTTF